MLKRFLPILVFVSLFLNASMPGSLAAVPAQAPTPAPGAADFPAAAPPVQPAAPSDSPTLLLDGYVSTFTASNPLVYWLTQPFSCVPSPDASRILRIRATGWEMRYLFNRWPASGDPCPYQVYSNLAADNQYLYWVDSSGLVRLPVDANPADAPQTILPAFAATQSELVLFGDYLAGISEGHIWYMSRADPSQNFAIGYYGPDTGAMLKTDGTYLYFIQNPGGNLRRFTLQGNFFTIDTGVTDFAPSLPGTICTGFTCKDYHNVYYVKNSAPLSIKSYSNVSGQYDTAYTATLPPGYTARIYGLTVGKKVLSFVEPDLFFWEKRWVPGIGFEFDSTDYLTRLYSGVIYTRASKTSWQAEQTQASGDFLFWKDMLVLTANKWGSVYRLPQDAAALPVVNLRVWDWEVNQSVQDQFQSVGLIRNKRTFLRLFVSADNGKTINGVTARLAAYWGGGWQGTIAPVTPLITVTPTKSKLLYANQFFFDLPLEWTNHNDLVLVPELNPFGFPLEPSYGDNHFSAPLGPFSFQTNPQARFQLVQASYSWKGVTYTSSDQNAIASWLYRAYPIGIDPGQAMPGTSFYSDAGLGSRVQDYNNDKNCQSLDQSGKGGSDDRNLCASYYLHSQLDLMRRNNSLPNNAYLYASVSGLARGSASPSAPVANGPDYIAKGTAFALAGFYGGHEIGHLLGRAHPDPMSDDPATKNVIEACGHSRSDPNFPYVFGWIGEPANDIYGVDSRLNVPGGVVRAMRYADINDVMTYCGTPDQWVSDYTYNGMYGWLTQHPTPPRPAQARLPQRLSRPGSADTVQVDGWLSLAGLIASDGSTAAFNAIQRSDSLTLAPAQVPGPYTLRLQDGSGQTLADYAFTPLASDESPDWLTFIESVPFVSGTRAIQIVRNADGAALETVPVSPDAPTITISAARLAARPAARPAQASQQVTLSWNASDLNNDPLTFDVLFSLDGVSFRPVEANLSGDGLTVDASKLPGGNGFFRVIASDGVNTSYADSAPLQIDPKPPVMHILTPSDGQQAEYSAPLNFSGYADDLQDGSLTGDMLTWSTQYGSFATGPNATASVMPTGWVTVTLSAQNSAGLTGLASVRIYVGDNLSDPLPILAAAPAAVNFQAENGSVTPLSAVVQISNGGGGGSLTWSADLHGTPWLSADVLSGTTPYSLTLTAAPSGLAPSGNYTAVVTLSATGGGGPPQSIDIAVNLQTGPGSAWNPPALPQTERKVYLPIVTR